MSTYNGNVLKAVPTVALNECGQARVPITGGSVFVALSEGTVLSVYAGDNRENVVLSFKSYRLTESDIKKRFGRPVFIKCDKHPAGQWDIVTGFRNNKVRGFRMFQKYNFSKCQFFDSEV